MDDIELEHRLTNIEAGQETGNETLEKIHEGLLVKKELLLKLSRILKALNSGVVE